MKLKKQRKELARSLVKLYDEFADFHDHCAFFCDAYSCLAAEDEFLNPDTTSGVRLHGEWLKRRVGKFKQELGRIHELSRAMRDRDTADTDAADEN